jgi:hypothetical protein
MIEMIYHTIVDILCIIILTAVAAIATSIAYVVVKVVFCNDKSNDSTNPMNNVKV